MSVVDAAMTREVLRDLGKRPVDISNLDVHVQHGVIYLRGRMETVRGYWDDVNLQEELNIILKLLRQKMGVRDVVCEVEFGGMPLAERAKARRPSH
jgi:hypothetical protein